MPDYPNHPKISRAILTTGAVAKLFGCSPRLVSQWCDNEGLNHYRLPKGGDRRIPVADLRKFARERGMILPEPLSKGVQVLGLGIVLDSIPGSLPVRCSDSLIEFGSFIDQQAEYHVFAIDGAIGRSIALTACRELKRMFPLCRIIAVVPEDETAPEDYKRSGAAIVLQRAIPQSQIELEIAKVVYLIRPEEGQWPTTNLITSGSMFEANPKGSDPCGSDGSEV